MIKKCHRGHSVLTRKGKIDREKAVYIKERLLHKIPVGKTHPLTGSIRIKGLKEVIP